MDFTTNWLDTKTSFYKNHSDRIGKPATFRQILFSSFADDLPAIMQLKGLDPGDSEKKRELKKSLAAYSMNLMEGRINVKSYSGLMQLDFDKIADFDIEELKEAIFSLPFIAFCGTSCSGRGLYAFAKIAEPERLKDYAQHVFEVFKYYQIPIDTTKGGNYNDLRYVSYDANMLYRISPKALCIKRFYKPEQPKRHKSSLHNDDGLIRWAVSKIQSALVGNRFEVVRKISFTMGGHNAGLDEIRNAILQASQYTGEENEFIKVAEQSFRAGQRKPITA